MLRRFARSRRTFAPDAPASCCGARERWESVARRAAGTAQILAVPLAVLSAAAACLVFVVLLPICGIASIAECVARGSWRVARGALRGERDPGAWVEY